MLCFSCDEYCPYNSHPFDLKNELQEKYQSQNIPPALAENSITMYAAKTEFKPRQLDPEKPVLNKCAFPKQNAKEMSGPMFDNLQSVGGLHYFCQLVYQHVAKPSLIRERVPMILDHFKQSERLDPKEKDFSISRKGHTRSWKKLIVELDKCVMLCNNCHAEIHDGIVVL